MQRIAIAVACALGLTVLAIATTGPETVREFSVEKTIELDGKHMDGVLGQLLKQLGSGLEIDVNVEARSSHDDGPSDARSGSTSGTIKIVTIGPDGNRRVKTWNLDDHAIFIESMEAQMDDVDFNELIEAIDITDLLHEIVEADEDELMELHQHFRHELHNAGPVAMSNSHHDGRMYIQVYANDGEHRMGYDPGELRDSPQGDSRWRSPGPEQRGRLDRGQVHIDRMMDHSGVPRIVDFHQATRPGGPRNDRDDEARHGDRTERSEHLERALAEAREELEALHHELRSMQEHLHRMEDEGRHERHDEGADHFKQAAESFIEQLQYAQAVGSQLADDTGVALLGIWFASESLEPEQCLEMMVSIMNDKAIARNVRRAAAFVAIDKARQTGNEEGAARILGAIIRGAGTDDG